jgi:protein phosphatase
MTHRGAVRRENQDALYAAGEVRIGDMSAPEVLTLKEPQYPLLLAVIDGMGGYEGGARAARIVAETLAQEVGAGKRGTEQVGKDGFFGARLGVEADGGGLRFLLEKAAARMEREARRDPTLSEMGATIAGVLLREKSALVFNCGDCRVYRFSGDLAGERLTREHSVVQTLYEQGKIDEDAMRSHPQKNVVTSAITMDGKFDLYTKAVSRCESDAFFLCSDGVWETFSARQLAEKLSLPQAAAAQGLFDALFAARCRDNVSFVWQTGGGYPVLPLGMSF